MASEHVQTITDGNFDQTVLKASAPVLVDFWAEWCGPCRMIGPTIDQVATELAGKAVIGKPGKEFRNDSYFWGCTRWKSDGQGCNAKPVWINEARV